MIDRERLQRGSDWQRYDSKVFTVCANDLGFVLPAVEEGEITVYCSKETPLHRFAELYSRDLRPRSSYIATDSTGKSSRDSVNSGCAS